MFFSLFAMLLAELLVPQMLGVSWLTPFGDTANITAPLYAAAVNKQPAGARTRRSSTSTWARRCNG